MWEMGLGKGDPETHIGQLTNALLRNVRFLSAIGLHTHGMTVADSEQMFREQAFTDAGTARQQAARGTYDPAYLNYTMGKLMIRKLREDWTATRGGRKAGANSTIEFLTYGGPPIPMVRQQMIGSSTGSAVLASLRSEHPHDRGGDAPPLAFLANELASALARQRVEPRLAVVLRRSPVRLDELTLFQPLQRRIERPVIDDQDVVGLVLNRARDGLSVLRAEDERAQDQQVERALQVRGVLAVGPLSDRHSTRVCVCSGRMST